MAIDHNVTKPVFPITQLDLCTTSGQAILWDLLHAPALAGIHLGIPCGTASRARERKIPQELRRAGVPQPPPLRSAVHPLGIHGLSDLNKLKVQAANDLYRLCAEVIAFCMAKNIVVSVENPRNSHLWSALVHIFRMQFTQLDCQRYNALEMNTFHSCCHGSKRQKLTGWLATAEAYTPLNALCDNSHEHLPFGVTFSQGRWCFDTSQEAAYPRELAQKAAACLKAFLSRRGIRISQQPRLHDLSTAVEGMQSKRHQPLISEFHHFVTVSSTAPPPPNSKLTSPHQGGDPEEVKPGHSRYGIYHTPEQFVSKALELGHPMDTTQHLEEETSRAINHVLSTSPELLKIQRRTAILKMRILAKQLQQEETKLHAELPDCIEKVLSDKKLLLWKSLLEINQYDDMGVVDLVFKGVDLVGMPDSPPCYPTKVVPATMTESDLRNTAVWRRKALINKRVADTGADHRAHLEETAEEELQARFLEGPYYSEAEVSKILGHERWSVIRRFVLVQGAELKLRPIDDALEGQLNFGFTAVSYLKLQDLDYVAGLALYLAEALLSGKQRSGSKRWLGKCLDLSKAYKQLPIAPAHRDLAVIFFRDTKDRTVFYIPNSLIFGSTAAVYAFNRVSRSIWFLLNRVVHIPCCVFYDDYPLFSPAESAEDADATASEFLDILGWRHARTGPKGLPFQEKFTVLGSELDLSALHLGTLVLANKPGRIERITQLLSEHSRRGTMTLHEAQVLHGLFRHACGFFAGRAMVQLCCELLSLGNPVASPSSDHVRAVCDYAIEVLKCSAPRVIGCNLDKTPICIFTDGSWENGEAGVGAVVIDRLNDVKRVFAGNVGNFLIDMWTKHSPHIICQIELYVLVLLRWLLKEEMKHRRCIFFVDNDAARFSTIKGSSSSDTMRGLVRAFFAFDLTHPTYSWIERVPSSSNPADSPSRGKPGEACSLFGISTWEELTDPPELMQFLSHGLVCSRGRKT